MTADRRDFLARTATAAVALTIDPHAQRFATANAPAMPEGASPTRTAGAADVKAFERRMLRARPVPLARVRLTGGPLKHAQEITATYLLSLNPDSMLAPYRTSAGLTKKAEPFTGWDGGGRNLTGHIAGHHLSAASLMFEATGDARFKARADYIVKELDEVQKKQGDGYVGALEGLRAAFAKVSQGDIRSGAFDLNGLWSPWYTLHKTYAGLRDAYRHTGNARALEIEKGFAAWAEGVLKPMSDEQVQKMLLTEHGGMNEVLADLYADTGDTRWLDLSWRFEHRAFTEPLKRHQDNLSGKHGNCQIPKLIGSAQRYGYTGDPQDIMAASFFWDRVVHHHSYASGGHGLAEYFGQPDHLSTRVDGRAAETCNVYNMIKLSRRLFSLRPDAEYADFHERALFNHILASIEPESGATSYMVPVGHREQQEYQDMMSDFTCCVGTGMESHALHGYGVWYESDDTIWANLFVPSTAECDLGRAKLEMESRFPDGDAATIRVSLPAPKEFTLAVRRPVWAGDGFTIAVNGTPLPQPALASLNDPVAGGRAGGLGNESEKASSSYVRIKRTWRSGDVVSLALPKSVRLEPTADDPRVTAFMWGPLALASDVAPRRAEDRAQRTPLPPVQAFVSQSRDVNDLLEPTSRSGDFRAKGVLRVVSGETAAGLSFAPFYRTHRRTYGIYHDLLTPAEFDARVAGIAAARDAAARLEAATVGRVVVGEPKSEQDANYHSEPADRAIGRTNGRTQRAGTGWISYEIAVDPASPMRLVVTYFAEPGLPAPTGDFGFAVDGTSVARYVADQSVSGFNDVTYLVPEALTNGRSKVTVRIEAAAGGRIVPLFSIRAAKR